MYYLTLTFFVIAGQGSGIGATTIPKPYPTYESCEIAALQSKKDYNGGAVVDWVCTQ